MVQMKHPKLPNQPIEVAEISAEHYERSGWQRVEPKKPYDNGGELKPGVKVAYNDTGKPEKVQTAKGKSNTEGEN